MEAFVPFRFAVKLFSVDESELGEAQRRVLCAGAFSEVSGLEVTMTPKSIREGGRNWGEVHLAGPTSFAPIVLKRGVTSNEELWQWFDLTHRQQRYDLRYAGEIDVLAPDDDSRVLLRWQLEKVIPSKFRGASLNSTVNQVAVEELTLLHEGLTLVRPSAEEQPNA